MELLSLVVSLDGDGGEESEATSDEVEEEGAGEVKGYGVVILMDWTSFKQLKWRDQQQLSLSSAIEQLLFLKTPSMGNFEMRRRTSRRLLWPRLVKELVEKECVLCRRKAYVVKPRLCDGVGKEDPVFQQ